MMKNTEWGAVAYLSQSKYGKNSEIDVNNNETTYYTGGGSTNTYKTNVGQSTTGNITGVYDMSGNSYDYVMGVIEDNTKTKTPMSGNSLTNYHYSGFMGKAYDGTTWTSITGITFPYKKYYNLYEYGTTSNDQIAYNRSLLGDAVGETRGWNSDLASFVYNSEPWFVRGAWYGHGLQAGIYYFSKQNGDAFVHSASRYSIVLK